MTAFRPGSSDSGGFGRRPQHSTELRGPWLTVTAYALAALSVWAHVLGWATPVGEQLARSVAVALVVAGGVLAGVVHAQRGGDASWLRTAVLLVVWVGFAVVSTLSTAAMGGTT